MLAFIAVGCYLVVRVDFSFSIIVWLKEGELYFYYGEKIGNSIFVGSMLRLNDCQCVRNIWVSLNISSIFEWLFVGLQLLISCMINIWIVICVWKTKSIWVDMTYVYYCIIWNKMLSYISIWKGHTRWRVEKFS